MIGGSKKQSKDRIEKARYGRHNLGWGVSPIYGMVDNGKSPVRTT